MKKQNQGITLIALIITIIVLIILAGVTINMLLDDNGVIGKAQEAKQKMQIASEREKIELVILEIYTEKTEKGNGKVTVDNVIDKLIEKGIITEADATRPEEGGKTGTVTLDSGNSYTLTEDENTVKVDYNGPSGEVKPKLEIRKDTEGLAGKVTITIIATDNVNGIKQILKDGKEIGSYPEGTKTVTETIEITENGTYEITVISNSGKETKEKVVIGNIDKDAPVVRYEILPEEGNYGKEVTITITAEDSNGITSITTPEGTVNQENLTKVNDTTYQTTYTVTENGTYHFSVTDESGNALEDYTVTIENIDSEGPEITGIEKEVGQDAVTIKVTEVRDNGVGTVGAEYRYWISKDNTWTEYKTSTTHTFEGLTGGTEYTIKVQAKDSLGNVGTEFSTTVTTETADPNPNGEKFSEIKGENTQVTSNGKTAVVPQGFAVGTSNGINSIDNGLVITDEIDEYGNSTGNEYVWIPVTVTSTDSPTKVSAFARDTSSYPFSPDKARTKNLKFWEPYTGGGLSASNDLTGEFAELAALTASVYKYHGFYVARFEAGWSVERYIDYYSKELANQGGYLIPSKKGVPVCNGVSWGASLTSADSFDADYGLSAVELARSVYPSASDAKVVSHLMYGAEWDSMIRFLSASGHNVINSASWGNHYDSTAKISSHLTTGANELWKANNLYDVAGNVHEYTMEVCSFQQVLTTGEVLQGVITGRVARGGYPSMSGNNTSGYIPASGRSCSNTTLSSGSYSYSARI